MNYSYLQEGHAVPHGLVIDCSCGLCIHSCTRRRREAPHSGTSCVENARGATLLPICLLSDSEPGNQMLSRFWWNTQK